MSDLALKRKVITIEHVEPLTKYERQVVLAKALEESFEKTGIAVRDFTWFSNKEI
ncbi:MAG: hypothetical protein Q9M19_02095 [Mariprofundaceae bacterium]|nr:hypothetical protein [Mariprofundaceae bacterium]